jgi:uncharacterized protein YjbI with pentapeptide repeats
MITDTDEQQQERGREHSSAVTTDARAKPRTSPDSSDSACSGRVAHADVRELLKAYRSAIALARHPPPSITLPRHGTVSRTLRALHMRIRPTWGAERWASRRVRRRLEALERGFAERLAVGTSDDNDESDREALRHFQEALPPPSSRLVIAGTFVAVVLLAQIILDLLEEALSDPAGSAFEKALLEVGPSLDVASTKGLVDALLHSTVAGLALFSLALSWGAYLIMRPPASGYRIAGLALGRPDGLGLPRRRSELTTEARRLRVADEERELFDVLRVSPPRELPFDLAVKAVLCVPLLFFGGAWIRLASEEEGDTTSLLVAGLVVVGTALVRLLFLAIASQKRGSGLTWLGVPTILIAIAIAVPQMQDPQLYDDQTTVAVGDEQLSLTLSLRTNLSGVDLRGRDLRGFYLYGKNLGHAALTRADLRNADLSLSDLSHADLRAADLSDATLYRADLERAVFENSDLSDANLYRSNLTDAFIADSDFSEINLSSVDLERAKFRDTNLTGGDLSGADLRDAKLIRVTLKAADLRGADLRGADLRGADLTDADVSRASFTNSTYDESTVWPKGRPPFGATFESTSSLPRP